MRQILIRDVILALEQAFPPRLQEDYDNTGLQVGIVNRVCTGVMVCVDVTPEIIIDAVGKGCNLIVSHHPLIFRPIKNIMRFNRVDISIYKAIQNDIAVYSCHTSVDNTLYGGVSWTMGRMLGLADMEGLEKDKGEGVSSGVVGNLPEPLGLHEFAERVKAAFGSPVVRCSSLAAAPSPVRRVALCGGAGNFLIPAAIASGAQAFVTSDCKHNDFIDYPCRIFLVDIGHYEAEKCTKEIFSRIIREKFPNFAVCYSDYESNPLTYL